MRSTTVVQIGEPPWTRESCRAELHDFEALYAARPVRDNAGGMGAPHMFATWCIARQLAPEVVVESGVWRGQSTWLLEQACPDAELHSIDLNLDKRTYISPSARYHSADFTELDWSCISGRRALVLFDDHQNAYNRLIHARWFGFEHVIFEDNSPPGSGDFYSLKMAFASSGFGQVSINDASRQYRRVSARLRRRLHALTRRWVVRHKPVIPQYSRGLVPPNRFDDQLLRQNLECYVEFPPAFDPEKSHPTPAALLERSDAHRYPCLFRERSDYNWLCYARLRGGSCDTGHSTASGDHRLSSG